MLLNVPGDALGIRAAYYEGPLASVVDHIFSEFETLLLNVLERGSATIPTTAVQRDFNHVWPLPKTDDVEEDEVLSEHTSINLETLQRLVSGFLGVEQEHLYPTLSLFSVGLDSIKSIALARLLRQQGFNVTATDILRRPSLQMIERFVQSSHGVHQDETGVKDEFFREQLTTLRHYVDPSNYKSCASDEVALFPTTALQAGMLSQVWTFACFREPSLTFTRLLPHQDICTSMHLYLLWIQQWISIAFIRLGFTL